MSIFNSVPSFTPPRSRQLHRSTRAQDMELGIAYPVYFKELVPGDNVHISLSNVVRSLPMVKPTMGDLDICVNAFFVDYRQIDPNFEDNLSGGETGEVAFSEVIDPAWNEDKDPDARFNGYQLSMYAKKYSLEDYCGVPIVKDSSQYAFIGDEIKLCPYRMLAYNRSWNYYYRDENTVLDSKGLPLYEHDKIGDGRPRFCSFGNSEGNKYCLMPGSGLKHVYLEKDYLNSVLPRKTKGGPFAFPISGNAPVNYNSSNLGTLPLLQQSKLTNVNVYDGNRIFDNSDAAIISASGTYGAYIKDDNGKLIAVDTDTLLKNEAGKLYYNKPLFDFTGKLITVEPSPGKHVFPKTSSWDQLGPAYASLDNSVTFTYDEFREIRALQLYAERLNLCGSRYEEFLMSMFSVAPHSDTLREPVWLGGFSQPLVIGEVMQSTETDKSPLGNYAGKASSSTAGHFVDYFSKDYGVLLIICHIRPKVLYTQGIDRQMIKRSRFDYFNPIFAGLSEQEVLKCEAYTAPVPSADSHSGATEILGFNPRYSEMYFDKSTVCGDLRDKQPYWVWSREFGQNAVLNGEFALCKHSEFSDRWAVVDLPPFISEFNFSVDITRPCSAYPLPSK